MSANQFGLDIFNTDDLARLSFLPANLLKILEYHRGLNDFDTIHPDKYYLYTGRGPSMSSFHIGHLLGLNLILEIQKFIGNKIYFMISDDEKILRDKISENEMKDNVNNTIKQLNKIGFNKTNTDINVNSNCITPREYQLIIKLMGLTTMNQLEHIFGKKDNIGEYFYVFVQLMPCFLYPDKQCIIIAGKDQDPFFRLARDLAKRLNHPSPIIIYTKNVPGLDGSDKMSTSVSSSIPIFVSDSDDDIKNKIASIKKVGTGSLDQLFEFGANLNIDIPFILVELFDQNKLNVKIIKKYYEKAQTIDNSEVEIIENLVTKKGYKIRNGTIVITTYGVRLYLANLMINMLQNYK
jgi:tryptophanyl-tRNA synthetase